eukprot:PhM_4_TR18300/c0_g1_i1/m.65207
MLHSASPQPVRPHANHEDRSMDYTRHVPGPGHYNVTTSSAAYTSPSTSLDTTRGVGGSSAMKFRKATRFHPTQLYPGDLRTPSERAFAEDRPGPKYNVAKSPSRTRLVMSFARTSERKALSRQDVTPGPGQYSHLGSAIDSKRATTFTSARRDPPRMHTDTPGPGGCEIVGAQGSARVAARIQRVQSANPYCGFTTSRRSEVSDWQRPGEGAGKYHTIDRGFLATRPNSAVTTIAKPSESSAAPSPKKADGPGPGQYNVSRAASATRARPPSATITSRHDAMDRVIQGSTTNFVAPERPPTAAKVSPGMQPGAAFSRAERNCEIPNPHLKEDVPAAKYDLSGFSSTRRKHVRDVKFTRSARKAVDHSTLGPGPVTSHGDMSKDRTCTFARSLRPSHHHAADGPGPGSYDTARTTMAIRRRPLSVPKCSTRDPYGAVINYGIDSPGPKYVGDIGATRATNVSAIHFPKSARSSSPGGGGRVAVDATPSATSYHPSVAVTKPNPHNTLLYLTG